VNVLSLFSGIGGLDLGLERAGMTMVGQVEIDPWCRKVLAQHWPEVLRHDDVRTCVQWWGRRAAPDLVAGGFPCQSVSTAGKKLAQADERWLWPDMAAVIAALKPVWVIAENVSGLRTRGLADVLRDLAGLGYRARAGYISACEVGAPHPRRRLFTLAHTADLIRRPVGRGMVCGEGPSHTETPIRDIREGLRGAGNGGSATRDWWATEPGVDRVAYGLPGWVDRTRGLGNAVVPQVAEHIGRLIMEAA
jgi:DNA (cytosine-5)-methyltransferase 1